MTAIAVGPAMPRMAGATAIEVDFQMAKKAGCDGSGRRCEKAELYFWHIQVLAIYIILYADYIISGI